MESGLIKFTKPFVSGAIRNFFAPVALIVILKYVGRVYDLRETVGGVAYQMEAIK